jgi:allantoinase
MSNPRVPFRMSNERPRLEPLEGKPLMVHVVVNVEHWRFDEAMPRALISSPHGLQSIPDVPNFSWVEYGMRCGLPRILGLLGDRGIPASASINAVAIDVYPSAAEAIRDAGWEFIGHGVHQRSLQAVDDERAVIVETLELIESSTGVRPRGWLGPGLSETFETPDVLKDVGVEYVCDWTIDDLPVWMETIHGPLIAMPYSLELNDSVLHAVERYPSKEVHDRLVETLATFERELREQPRVLTLPLHPHLIGVPHRIGFLERALDLLRSREDTVFVTGSQIADWYVQVEPPDG